MTLHRNALILLLLLPWDVANGALPTAWCAVLALRSLTSAEASFAAASFKGVHFGKSKRRDVLRILGRPKAEVLGDGDIYLTYDNVWIEEGEVQILIDSKTFVALEMVVYPRDSSLRSVSGILGPDYIETRWEFAMCINDGGSSPIYRSPNGQFLYREYRTKGIAVSIENDSVKFVEYRSVPLGYAKDPCEGRREQLGKGNR